METKFTGNQIMTLHYDMVVYPGHSYSQSQWDTSSPIGRVAFPGHVGKSKVFLEQEQD